MARRQLTEEEWANARAEHQAELLDTHTSWEPFSAEYIYDIATGEIARLLPSLWQRDDGKYLMYRGRTHVFLGETETCKTFVALEIMAQEIRTASSSSSTWRMLRSPPSSACCSWDWQPKRSGTGSCT
jgi:hypothetical protein